MNNGYFATSLISRQLGILLFNPYPNLMESGIITNNNIEHVHNFIIIFHLIVAIPNSLDLIDVHIIIIHHPHQSYLLHTFRNILYPDLFHPFTKHQPYNHYQQTQTQTLSHFINPQPPPLYLQKPYINLLESNIHPT